jgi:hypothetical protein
MSGKGEGTGSGHRIVLDSYLETVREIERRIEVASQRDLSDIQLRRHVGPQDAFDEQVKLMFDLIVLAYRADLTRVVSYMMASEGTARTYNHIGVSMLFTRCYHANRTGSNR